MSSNLENENSAAESKIFSSFEDQETSAETASGKRTIDAMYRVEMNVQVVVGKSRMPISDLIKITRGSIIDLDRKIGEPVDIVVSNVTIGRGDLMKMEDGRLGIKVTDIIKEIVSPYK
jgi:flagellar motor switch protein FliN/FliY